MKRWSIFCMTAFLVSGCASWLDQFKKKAPEWDEVTPEVVQKDPQLTKNQPGQGPKRYRREDFVDSSTTEGSLWASDGQTNYFFTKNRVKSVGDLITVALDDGFVKELASSFKRALIPAERENEIALIQEERDRIRKEREARAEASTVALAGGLGGDAKPAAPVRAPSAEEKNNPQAAKAEIPANFDDVDVLSKIEAKAGDKWLAEVVERFPNGNYRVKLSHQVLFKSIARQVSLMAIVKSGDLDEADTVPTGKLYEYQLRLYR